MAKLEKVQRRAIAMLKNLINLSYEERLVTSLKLIILVLLVVQRWHVDNLSDTKWIYWHWHYWIFWSVNTTHIWGHSRKLYSMQTYKIWCQKRIFSNRIIKKWNSKPSNVIENTSINDDDDDDDDLVYCIDLSYALFNQYHYNYNY